MSRQQTEEANEILKRRYGYDDEQIKLRLEMIRLTEAMTMLIDAIVDLSATIRESFKSTERNNNV